MGLGGSAWEEGEAGNTNQAFPIPHWFLGVFSCPCTSKPVSLPKPRLPLWKQNTGVCCPSPQSSCWASWLCCDRVKSINPCKFLIVAWVVLSLVVDLGLFLDWKKDFGRKSSSDRGPMYQLVLDELRDPVLWGTGEGSEFLVQIFSSGSALWFQKINPGCNGVFGSRFEIKTPFLDLWSTNGWIKLVGWLCSSLFWIEIRVYPLAVLGNLGCSCSHLPVRVCACVQELQNGGNSSKCFSWSALGDCSLSLHLQKLNNSPSPSLQPIPTTFSIPFSTIFSLK